MEGFNRKEHWEKIYQNKNIEQVSWYQPIPHTSLEFVNEFNLNKDAAIIDIGGGDSFFVDHLLETGFTNITVLDISAKAIDKAKARLGDKANAVKWIVADAANFSPTEKYDFWHDRAAFHFLTSDDEIRNYANTVFNYINSEGYLVIGTFSEQGPTKCSGIDIKQYSEESMNNVFKDKFQLTKSIIVDHKTPFDTVQNFIFCCFKKE